MTLFGHQELKQWSKPGRFFRSVLKDALAQCLILCETSPAFEEDYSLSDAEAEQEVLILTIRKAMEAKMRQKERLIGESFKWELPPIEGDMVIIPKETEKLLEKENDDSSEEEFEDAEEREDYFSMKSCFSCCSSVSREALFSARSCFSRCSSGSRIELWDVRRRLMIKEFCHCQGWPFGLYRRAILLPPLPKSPSESWSWRGGTQRVKML